MGTIEEIVLGERTLIEKQGSYDTGRWVAGSACTQSLRNLVALKGESACQGPTEGPAKSRSNSFVNNSLVPQTIKSKLIQNRV